MKLKYSAPFLLSALLWFTPISNTFANESNDVLYVKDSVSIPVKSSPEGRTIGYLSNGDRVTEVSKRGVYTQISTKDKGVVWIESQFLQKEPSLKFNQPILEKKIRDLTAELDNIEASQAEKWNSLKQTAEKLTAENKTLIEESKKLKLTNNEQKKQIDELSFTADRDRQDLILRWFTHGGLVAGAAFILGLILPRFFRKKRNSSSW